MYVCIADRLGIMNTNSVVVAAVMQHVVKYNSLVIIWDYILVGKENFNIMIRYALKH